MGDMFKDEILEGIWENENIKTNITVLLRNDEEGQYTLNTSEDTGLWDRFFEKFKPTDVDYFTEKNKQAHIVDQKKEQQKNKTEDALKDLFEAKLKAFEIEEVKNSENKFLRSKIRKSQNMIELNAWVTAILLESIPQEDE
tara:strand:+ start:2180 stop:2602 length:423 start_codon:yes stop_codon:yes gene_type:complete